MSIATDGFGSIIAGLETGGGTVVPPNGDLEGSYDGNIVCEGDVNLTGNLTVSGSMVVLGDFINAGGHEVTIRGDLHAQGIYFNRSDTSANQSNFTVDGDLIFTYMEFVQTGDTPATLRVGGDLIGASGFGGTQILGYGVDGSEGVPGTAGLTILVYGDLQVTDVQVQGGGNAAGAAGNGGSVIVWGDCIVLSNLNASGGNSTDGDAGAGGFVDVYGDLFISDGTVSVRGGDATNGSGGNGGNLDVEGNFTGSEISAYGGNSESNSELHRAGSGGNISVYGMVTWCGYMVNSGGDRYGTLTTGNTLDQPNAGEINVNGGIFGSDIFSEGGSVYTVDYAPHNAGNGGYMYVNGFLTLSDDLQFNGGDADTNAPCNGGNGGFLDVEGITTIEDDFEFDGGFANNGNGGSGGNVYIYGSLIIDECRMGGGSGTQGSGGQGAQLFVKGDLTINEFYDGAGGSCTSTDENHFAGAGGSIDVEGHFSYFGDDDYLYMSGGSRYGATTAPNLGVLSAQGGSVDVGGNFVCRTEIYLEGGSVYTDYPNAPGGQGGSLYVSGSLYCDGAIYMSGGRSVGNTGGQGGNLVVFGHAGLDDIEAAGGDSAESVVTGDAGQAGSGGGLFFRSGLVADFISMLDGTPGAGGSPAALEVNLMLSGHCSIGSLNMSDRSICYIRKHSSSNAPVVLKVDNMPTKTTLNAPDGTPTNDISLLLDESVFSTRGDGSWFYIAGAAIP